MRAGGWSRGSGGGGSCDQGAPIAAAIIDRGRENAGVILPTARIEWSRDLNSAAGVELTLHRSVSGGIMG